MLFSRSISFDDEEQVNAIGAAPVSTVISASEARFIEKLKEGDAEAFDRLVTLYSSDVFGLLFRLTGDKEEASDLTQDTFLSALNAVKGFRGRSRIRTWLFRIAINHSRNRFRWWKRRQRDRTVSFEDAIGVSELRVHETIPAVGPDPEENAVTSERERALLNAVATLPTVFREAVVLCDVHGLSYEEISSVVGVGLGTVKSRIARGREELRRKLKAY